MTATPIPLPLDTSCSIKGCDREHIAMFTVVVPGYGERRVLVCEGHLHLARGGAIFTFYLKPEALEPQP